LHELSNNCDPMIEYHAAGRSASDRARCPTGRQ
jgi:hypothetical protein